MNKTENSPSPSVTVMEYHSLNDTSSPIYTFNEGAGEKSNANFDDEGIKNDRFCVDHTLVGELNNTNVSVAATDPSHLYFFKIGKYLVIEQDMNNERCDKWMTDEMPSNLEKAEVTDPNATLTSAQATLDIYFKLNNASDPITADVFFNAEIKRLKQSAISAVDSGA